MLGVREANFQILDGDFVGTIADGNVALVFKQDAAIGLDFFDEADAKVKAIVVLKGHQTCFALRGVGGNGHHGAFRSEARDSISSIDVFEIMIHLKWPEVG